jgi:hypothetical protein
MSILAALAPQERFCMDRNAVEKKILYKVGDIVMDTHANIYKITKIGIEELYYDVDGNTLVKAFETNRPPICIAYADVKLLRSTPFTQFGSVTRMLGSDLWNLSQYQPISFEDALRKHTNMRILYGHK